LLTCRVSGERYLDLLKSDVWEVLHFYAAELTEEDMEKMTARNEPETEISDIVVESLQPTASALKRVP
jgi:hypothetical protein